MLNTMTRWTPSAAAVSRDPFFRLFDSFFGETPSEEMTGRAWTPPVDVQETEEGYRLFAELPGMTREDIQITLENNVLRLSGERKFEKDVKKENFHRIERSFGSFTRTFALPSQVDAERIQAAFENGVLTINLPKAEQAKPRKISIG
jgi:HSP20 family protein